MFRIFFVPGPVLLTLLAISTGTVQAHEFWIEPAEYRVAASGRVAADLRIGQNFKGDRFPYLPARFRRFEMADILGSAAIAGRTGALPAIEEPVRNGGMQIITYLSAPERLQFARWETFEAYLDYEGLDRIPRQHEERRLPRTGFTEIYIRCAKTLVMAGDRAQGTDRPTGMPLELVALGNPFAAKPGQPLEVRLLWQDKGVDGVQINIFRKGVEGPVSRVRTANGGLAVIPLGEPGPYLLNAVHMEAAAPQSGAAWQSHWATLTFDIEG